MKVKIVTLLLLIILTINPALANSDIELDIIRARILFEQSNFESAAKILRSLYQSNPKNARIIAAYAEVQNNIGNSRHALKLVEEAIKIDPKNQYFLQLKNNIFQNYQSFVLVGQEIESRDGGVRQRISNLQVEQSIAPFSNLGAEFLYNDSKTNLVTMQDGTIKPFSDTKTMGSIYFRHRFKNEDKIKLSAYKANKVNGIGARYDLSYSKGYNGLVIDYKKPSWAFLEETANFGSFNQYLLTNSFKLNSRINFNSTLGHKQYNIGRFDNIASSNVFTFLASYRFSKNNSLVRLLGDDGYMILNYNIDGEYVSSRNEKVDANGNNFRPINLQTREIHNIIFLVGKYLANNISGEVGLGFAKDRYRRSAPTLDTNIVYQYLEDLRFILYGYSRQNTVNSREMARGFGLRIKKSF